MAPMRTGLVHALAWTLATGAAVTLSWWGVHTVMSGTAYDPPRALPLPSAAEVSPMASSTHRPESPAPTARPPGPSASADDRRNDDADNRPPRSPSSSARASDNPPPDRPDEEPGAASAQGGADGEVKSYEVEGGRVVFDIGETSAELVSATPEAGWQMQVWTQPSWIRVTFTRDGREVSVFCTWNGHPPMVQFDER